MNPENTKKLREAYPTVFPAAVEKSYWTFERYGFECQDGWFTIIDELAAKLEQLGGVKCVQAKEKFGGLRFYVEPLDPNTNWDSDKSEAIYAFIREAEQKADVTCEMCGKQGKIGGTGWLKCFCAPCREADEAARKASR